MNFDKSIISELNCFIDKYIYDVIQKYGNRVAYKDKISHIKSATSISEQIYGDDMTVLATKYHDIGRFSQYELLGSFNDNIVTHNVLGENAYTISPCLTFSPVFFRVVTNIGISPSLIPK